MEKSAQPCGNGVRMGTTRTVKDGGGVCGQHVANGAGMGGDGTRIHCADA